MLMCVGWVMLMLVNRHALNWRAATDGSSATQMMGAGTPAGKQITPEGGGMEASCY